MARPIGILRTWTHCNDCDDTTEHVRPNESQPWQCDRAKCRLARAKAAHKRKEKARAK